METKAVSCAAVLELLDKDNYVDWRVRVKTYLMAQCLWDIVEGTYEPPKDKAWRKKNSMALHLIQISCGSDAFSKIKDISSAKFAWRTLERKYDVPENTVSGMYNDESTHHGEYLALCKDLRSGELNDAIEFFMLQPDAVNAKITILGQTALHIAVAAGHLHIVEELIGLMWEKALEIEDDQGNTALFEALFIGNRKMAECMLSKNKKLVSIGNKSNILPVVMAIQLGHTDLARYLYLQTPLEDLKPEKGINGATLFTQAIYTRSLDIALDLIQRCPRLTLAIDRENCSPLYALSAMPYEFPTGDQLMFWKRWIYACIRIPSFGATDEVRLNLDKLEKRQSNQASVLSRLRHWVSKLLDFFGIEHLYKIKLIHAQCHALLRRMCEVISSSNMQERQKGCVDGAIFCAIKNGNFDFLFHIVKENSDLLRRFDGQSRNIFFLAVLHRQAKLFSLIYGLELKNVMTSDSDIHGNVILHMAGMSEASPLLNRITGAALQMQRELQWFKEVESIVHPKVRKALNKDGLSPRELFTKNHKDMMKEGEQWMKGTATSCTVVAALIVTIMFTAAFTIPGGNNQITGYPIFLDKKSFMVFIISDAASLFSSSTSVLMFLGILTSRYSEDDFLKSLPRKMLIGLSALFISIATMMIAFSATLLIMLHRQPCLVIAVICFAIVPVAVFILMQFSLLVDMSNSTFGSGIFDRKMKRWV